MQKSSQPRMKIVPEARAEALSHSNEFWGKLSIALFVIANGGKQKEGTVPQNIIEEQVNGSTDNRINEKKKIQLSPHNRYMNNTPYCRDKQAIYNLQIFIPETCRFLPVSSLFCPFPPSHTRIILQSAVCKNGNYVEKTAHNTKNDYSTCMHNKCACVIFVVIVLPTGQTMTYDSQGKEKKDISIVQRKLQQKNRQRKRRRTNYAWKCSKKANVKMPKIYTYSYIYYCKHFEEQFQFFNMRFEIISSILSSFIFYKLILKVL